MFPAPFVHADLAALAALAVTDEQRTATLVQVSFAEGERLSDAKTGAPEHDDQSARAVAVNTGAGVMSASGLAGAKGLRVSETPRLLAAAPSRVKLCRVGADTDLAEESRV